MISEGGEGMRPLDREMMELMFLLPSGQAAVLERAARQRSLTVAQLVRQLIRDYVGHQAPILTGLDFPEAADGRCGSEEGESDNECPSCCFSWRGVMNWDQIKGNWKQFKGKVKEKWGQLTDDDLTAIEGQRDQLAGKLQERYGYGKEQAQREVDEFAQTLQA